MTCQHVHRHWRPVVPNRDLCYMQCQHVHNRWRPIVPNRDLCYMTCQHVHHHWRPIVPDRDICVMTCQHVHHQWRSIVPNMDLCYMARRRAHPFESLSRITREYRVVRNRYSRLLFTSEDRQSAHARTIDKYDVTILVPRVRVTSQINCDDVKM